MNPHLYSKNGFAAVTIARELLAYELGSRIPRVQDFAERLNLGRGTIQVALQSLVDSNVIVLDSRGSHGTYLESVNIPELWEVAGIKSVMATMPLPYSKRYEGLATGLYKAFESKIPFHITYMRGANSRIDALVEGRTDLAILSKKAALVALDRQEPVTILYSFGPHTYVGEHALLVRTTGINGVCPGMKVGIDSSSIDQSSLTKEVCEGTDVQFVELPYMQILPQLASGFIDAAVWSTDDLTSKGLGDDFHIVPLQESSTSTEAVVLVRQDDHRIFNNLLSFIPFDTVSALQKDVINDVIVPRY